MTQVKILTTQSILDFCLQTCGSAEALFDVMKLNSLNDLFVQPLIDLNVTDLIKNQRVVDFYKNNNITPGTIDRDFLLQFSLDFNCDFNNDFPVTCSGSEDFDNNDFDINDFG